jgi:hypothetical protein
MLANWRRRSVLLLVLSLLKVAWRCCDSSASGKGLQLRSELAVVFLRIKLN